MTRPLALLLAVGAVCASDGVTTTGDDLEFHVTSCTHEPRVVVMLAQAQSVCVGEDFRFCTTEQKREFVGADLHVQFPTDGRLIISRGWNDNVFVVAPREWLTVEWK